MNPAPRLPVERRLYVASPDEASDVEPLPAGDVTDGVVRVGGTVRRPHQPQSYAVADYLDWLEDAGFEESPRFLGRDGAGRDVLTFVRGECAGSVPERWAQSEELLRSVALLVRRLHEASAGFVPSRHPFPQHLFPTGQLRQDQGGLVCHLDVTPQNVVVRGGRAVGLIDFDLAGPGTGFKDSFNTAMHWAPLRDPADAWDAVDPFRRLRIFADAYGWTEDERRRLPQFGAEAARLSHDRMAHNARTLGGGWARMWAGGVGGLISRRGRWLEDNANRLVESLTD